jgi:hypothetical protein
MSTTRKTRCKVGDRARVTGALLPQNMGKIVVVVRPYRDREIVGGSSWVNDGNAWAVVSLGSPIAGTWNGEVTVSRTAVFNDAQLTPLSDDDDGLTRKAVRTKRKAASKPSEVTA